MAPRGLTQAGMSPPGGGEGAYGCVFLWARSGADWQQTAWGRSVAWAYGNGGVGTPMKTSPAGQVHTSGAKYTADHSQVTVSSANGTGARAGELGWGPYMPISSSHRARGLTQVVQAV